MMTPARSFRGIRIANLRPANYARGVLLGSFAICLTLFPKLAFAQIKNRFAIGGEYKIRATDRASQEDYAHAKLGPGLLWRVGHGHQGWGFHWGLNWYAIDIDRAIGGQATELGELKLRPFMAGYGYTYSMTRRLNITADVLGGYAFGSIDLTPTAIDAYRNRLGAQAATAKSTNTLVLKPEIGAWYDVNNKVGLNVNFGYMMARPDIIVSSTAGTDRRKVRADQFILKAGVVFSIF
jgi:hypothetical protein